MSAQGRGAKREYNDGYYTPLPLARCIARALRGDGYLYPGDRVLEPSVGRGAFVRAVMETVSPITLDACDLRFRKGIKALWQELDVQGEVERSDFLKLSTSMLYHLIVGNPPYDHAEEHIRHALEMLDRGGALAFLLRMNFLSSRGRVDGLFRLFNLDAVYSLDKRPSFDASLRCKGIKPVKCGWQGRYPAEDPRPSRCPACGQKLIVTQSDATEYGVFVWTRERRRQEPALRWIRWGDEYDQWSAERKERAKKRTA